MEDLPSQLDFEWSATPGPSVAPSIARNLREELDVANTPAIGASPTRQDMENFAEVSQIAQEAVMDATQHGAPDPLNTITKPDPSEANIAEANLV